MKAETLRITSAGRLTLDAAAQQANADANAAHAKVRERSADVEAAKTGVAPLLEKHLAQQEAESVALLVDALERVRKIAATIANVADVAASDGANIPLKYLKARSALVAARHALAQFK